MNRVMLIGRLTRDPEIHYSGDENSTAVAMYTLAVKRRYQKEEGQDTDFITCVTFGKSAEFAEKYFRKGLRAVSYTHLDVYKRQGMRSLRHLIK